MEKVYPKHIYEKVRQDVAVSYIQHEARKLFLSAPKSYWKILDKDIEGWINSPVLANPRDFWNGFHGICMGFKLIIGLIYYVTAENVTWSKRKIPITDLSFGVELEQTRIIRGGRLSASEVKDFYDKPQNIDLKERWLKSLSVVSGGKSFEHGDPVIVVQKKTEERMVYAVYDGNNRLAKTVLEGGGEIHTYVGEFTNGTAPQNYWVPTTILMELILFAKQAYDREDKEMFLKYMEILKDILQKSESAKYELKERSLTGSQEFKNGIITILGL